MPSSAEYLKFNGLMLFSKTTDFKRLATKPYQIPRLKDLRFSKTILEMLFSK